MHSPLQRPKPYKVLSELWNVAAIIIQMFLNPEWLAVMWEEPVLSPNGMQEGICLHRPVCLPVSRCDSMNSPAQSPLLETSEAFDEEPEVILEMLGVPQNSWLLDLLHNV